jgi:methylenetetrahydrofolate dehydrogenase (NADP+)/methenyltetrahydrofolate cyclohydrolase
VKLLNGRELAGFIKERQAQQVRALRQAHGVTPKLAIVQCKDDPVINTYVRLKQRYGADILIDVDCHMVEQAAVPELLEKLNADESVHGIIVQLPLAEPAETDTIVNLVAPEKDVDSLGNPDAPWPPGPALVSYLRALQGVDEKQTETYMKYGEGVSQAATQQSAKTGGGVSGSARKQASGVRGQWFEPATPMAIMWLLAGYNVDLTGKHVLLIGRGKLVGAPLERLLADSGIDVQVVDRETADLAEQTRAADVIITATGSPAILYPDIVKEGAVVVDAGVASEDGKTVGDVAPELYERDDLTITPAKGGVGPLTVCALFDNVIRAARRKVEASNDNA